MPRPSGEERASDGGSSACASPAGSARASPPDLPQIRVWAGWAGHSGEERSGAGRAEGMAPGEDAEEEKPGGGPVGQRGEQEAGCTGGVGRWQWRRDSEGAAEHGGRGNWDLGRGSAGPAGECRGQTAREAGAARAVPVRGRGSGRARKAPLRQAGPAGPGAG